MTVHIGNLLGELIVGHVPLKSGQPLQFFERERHLVRALVPHARRDGHQQIKIERGELAQRLIVELVQYFTISSDMTAFYHKNEIFIFSTLYSPKTSFLFLKKRPLFSQNLPK